MSNTPKQVNINTPILENGGVKMPESNTGPIDAEVHNLGNATLTISNTDETLIYASIVQTDDVLILDRDQLTRLYHILQKTLKEA